jgi:hypothetical protein
MENMFLDYKIFGFLDIQKQSSTMLDFIAKDGEYVMIGDKVVKVEHPRTISRMLNWSLNEKNVWVRDNLESINFALDFD